MTDLAREGVQISLEVRCRVVNGTIKQSCGSKLLIELSGRQM